jgi:hypothetical protein
MTGEILLGKRVCQTRLSPAILPQKFFCVPGESLPNPGCHFQLFSFSAFQLFSFSAFPLSAFPLPHPVNLVHPVKK